MTIKKDITDKRFKVVLSVGDESGVGPEIILKALFSSEIPKDVDIIIVGSEEILQKKYLELKALEVTNIANPNNLQIHNLKVSFKNNYGTASFHYLKKAIEIVKNYRNAALVTGPICKKSWSLAGHNYSGQTEFLAESCGVKNVGMLFTAKSPITGWRFNTLLATTHIALSEVPKELNINLIHSKLDLLSKFCSNYVKNPNLKVSGINPHAGEEGLLGSEEQNWLNDAITSWNNENKHVNLIGPVSPDSCWISSLKAWNEKETNGHDGILAMYHDQGLIPMKIIAFNYSVNTTLGLPIIRTSPDHGTGFDIFNKGIAQCQSILEAIKTANELCTKSRLLDTH